MIATFKYTEREHNTQKKKVHCIHLYNRVLWDKVTMSYLLY